MTQQKPTGAVAAEIQRDWDFFHSMKEPDATSESARQKRLARLSDFLGFELTTISRTSITSEALPGHIENFLGSVEVPVGMAGPLYFMGDHVRGPVLAPLATTEGALVASACRGSKLLNACGGVHTKSLGSRMNRAPAFTCRSTDEAVRLGSWVGLHLPKIREQITEPYAQLLEIKPWIHGRSLSLEFIYSTGDAAGQNMTTIATSDCCQWILHNAHQADVQILRHSIESGFSGDKKMSHNNFTQGRGTRVLAEAWIDDANLQRIMRIHAKDMLTSYLDDLPNYFMNGTLACNSNTANIVAALFAATGQDIACVHESSLGQLGIEPEGDGLYVSLLMPCLVVGTVGGGTNLPGQREALRMMGCQGPGTKERLAEIVVGYALALELSTFSAAVEGTFVKAHQQLGRRHESKPQ